MCGKFAVMLWDAACTASLSPPALRGILTLPWLQFEACDFYVASCRLQARCGRQPWATRRHPCKVAWTGLFRIRWQGVWRSKPHWRSPTSSWAKSKETTPTKPGLSQLFSLEMLCTWLDIVDPLRQKGNPVRSCKICRWETTSNTDIYRQYPTMCWL